MDIKNAELFCPLIQSMSPILHGPISADSYLWQTIFFDKYNKGLRDPSKEGEWNFTSFLWHASSLFCGNVIQVSGYLYTWKWHVWQLFNCVIYNICKSNIWNNFGYMKIELELFNDKKDIFLFNNKHISQEFMYRYRF